MGKIAFLPRPPTGLRLAEIGVFPTNGERSQGMLPGTLDGGDPRSASRFLFQTMIVKVL
jgi:hypothetical protein